jgi:large-conductance mechanosensitive channel
VIKQVNRFQAPPPAPKAPEPTAEEKLLGEIRDILKTQGITKA